MIDENVNPASDFSDRNLPLEGHLDLEEGFERPQAIRVGGIHRHASATRPAEGPAGKLIG